MTDLQPLRCQHDGVTLQGYVARPEGEGTFPTVMVMHSALGMRHMVRGKARELAALGYLAVATDMYGADADISSPEKAGAHYMPLAQDSALLRARTVAWFEAVAALDGVDPARIAAIGYCFGGQCAVEMARSGVDLKAAVSFHGLLTTSLPAAPGAIAGDVVAYCGADDPFGPPADTVAFRAEMAAAGARFHITEFAGVAHGFTDPKGEGGQPGIAYDAAADAISWAGTLALLDTRLRG